MKEKLPYLDWSDEDVVKEMEKRLKEIKQTLVKIKESLKTLGS
jgi:hypothetical protein